MLAPAERSLGSFVKLIYVHAAINWVGLALFSMAGVLGLIYLTAKNPRVFSWLQASQATAILVWAFHSLLGVISMRIIWNEFVWREPRMLFAFMVLIVAAVGYLISHAVKDEMVISVLNVVIAVVVWGLLSTTGNILHPKAAIVGSGNLAIKLYAFLITLSLFASGLGLVSLIHKDTKIN